MPCEAIISDWNGTLFEYATDEALNRRLGYRALFDDVTAVLTGRFWKIADVAKLLRAKAQLEKRLRQYYRGERHLQEVYEPFNESVLKGRPVAFVERVIDRFARESADKADKRVLRPIRKAHENGKFTGILSGSYDYSIKRILEESGFSDVFDVVVANTLQTNGNEAVCLTFRIYGRKTEVLIEEFFKKRGFRENNTVYLGDSKDDEQIAEILTPGNFIVPFLARDEFKQRMASKYKAFVPESEEDLMKYLQSR